MTSSTVELAVAAFALKSGLIVVVQAAMLGAILNNLLLVMGIAIVVGGISHKQQELKKATMQTSVNILMLTSMAYVVPIGLNATLTHLHQTIRPKLTDPVLLDIQMSEIRNIVDKNILTLSKFMAFVLLGIYFACLYYQYYHREFMITPEAKHEGSHTIEHRDTHYWFAAFGYLVAMGVQIYSAYLLVHAVEGLGRLHHLNDSFVGFILVPIVLVADLQEEIVAIQESKADRLDKTLSLMVGSCMQISLLVTPILVLLGWALDVPMTFKFTILEVVILASSVLITNYLLSDSSTNWLEGTMLLAVYLMCAIAFFYDDSHLAVHGGSTIGGGGGGGAH
ncbi:calcium/proton exchanger [Mortierella sp. GBAus27b]|nr:calcium/proton exchanger [Mortierella sp. GBAus27b]